MLSVTFIYASSNLDLSAGKIIGRNSDYYFEIPSTWKNYIYAKRDYSQGNDYFDKIDFYYKHRDIGNNDIKYLSLYAYNIGNYRGYKNQDVVLVTNKYVFTSNTYLSNPYNSTNDKSTFYKLTKDIANPNFLSNYIFVSTSTPSETQSGTLTVNGKQTSKMPIIENGDIYLPLRETCESLGYEVSWIANTKMILATRSDNSVSFSVNSTKNRNINGSVYLPLKFFMKNLGCNVDIDSKNNITIID